MILDLGSWILVFENPEARSAGIHFWPFEPLKVQPSGLRRQLFPVLINPCHLRDLRPIFFSRLNTFRVGVLSVWFVSFTGGPASANDAVIRSSLGR